jgi:hypothetical protein
MPIGKNRQRLVFIDGDELGPATVEKLPQDEANPLPD